MVVSDCVLDPPTTSLISHKMHYNPQLCKSPDPGNSIYSKLNTYSELNSCRLGHTVKVFYTDK